MGCKGLGAKPGFLAFAACTHLALRRHLSRAALIGGFAIGQAAPNLQYFQQGRAAGARVFEASLGAWVLLRTAPGTGPGTRASGWRRFAPSVNLAKPLAGAAPPLRSWLASRRSMLTLRGASSSRWRVALSSEMWLLRTPPAQVRPCSAAATSHLPLSCPASCLRAALSQAFPGHLTVGLTGC